MTSGRSSSSIVKSKPSTPFSIMPPAFDVDDLASALPPHSEGGGAGVSRSGTTSSRRNDASAASRTNQRLGQYVVQKTLGEGSFGKVKLAVHQVSGQKVALKIISRRKLSNRDMAGRVEREIQYLQLLRHPHIIKLYTVITTQSEIIMVLEYARDELFDYIVKHGKMGEDRARRFFQQIICAVEYCHRHKIVHRDLKPENLLLDENLNVKIADFGLSNIMTDGNFLKTSCGSPNYAAPEVISGKLYAGPEVDVWSCGVILYVSMVGRLPFDDEYIPSLFKKIAQGSYTIPSYLSPGAAHMIKKMLVVNPVHRIDVQEIRQDPWFNTNLPDYLKPPVEDFVDTGVDPNKAINPRALAPGKTAVVQEQIHQAVIGKLGKTMGYGKDDVQEALGKDEPNAIKDAYMIVRENQIMRTNPSLAQDEVSNPFLASSPPAYNAPVIPFHLEHREEPKQKSEKDADDLKPLTVSNQTEVKSEPLKPSDVLATESKLPRRQSTPAGYVYGPSKLGVLPTSIPSVWQQYMAGRQAAAAAEAEPVALDNDGPGAENPGLQSTEKQAATARAIQGQSRSQINLTKAAEKPESFTPITEATSEANEASSKKHRSIKWQFGIRSRNTPFEALACIYRALERLGANWVVHKTYTPPDPYLVQVRWEKCGMLPAGQAPSTHSSATHLPAFIAASGSAPESRRGSATPSIASAAASIASGTPPLTAALGVPPSSLVQGEPVHQIDCYVYIDIQVYQLPTKFYMVDFKLDGYERIEVIDGVRKGVGRYSEEKECTSPFPFLTMVSTLIMALADGE